MRKTNPFTKLRFKPQVSAAFASVSILIDANRICPKQLRQFSQCNAFIFCSACSQLSKSYNQIHSHWQDETIDNDVLGRVPPNVGECKIIWLIIQRKSLQRAVNSCIYGWRGLNDDKPDLSTLFVKLLIQRRR